VIQQSIFSFKIDTAKEKQTAPTRFASIAEVNHGFRLRRLTDQYLRLRGAIGETCLAGSFEVDNRSGEIGIVSRDQTKIL
jgi:hypothetical protein